MTMSTTDFASLAQRTLEAARKAGADSADCVVLEAKNRSIEVRDGVLEHAESAEQVELGLRALVGQRQAIVSVSDTSNRTIEEMAERAVVMARLAPEDPFAGLAEPALLSTVRDADGLELADPAEQPDPATLETMALEAEAASRAVKGVTKTDVAGAGASSARIYMASTTGFTGGYAATRVDTHSVAIAGEGLSMERDYAGESRVFASDLPGPREIGQLAGERAAARVGARKPPTGSYPVLYDERIAASLIGHLISAVNGVSITRGSSWLRDAMGDEVLPKGLSVHEDPLRPRIPGSRPFDGEGLESRASDIVRDGVLSRWTLDLATARQLGLESTANASRGVASPPRPSITNIALSEGTRSRAELLTEMGRGLLVTSMIGSTINATTGDYSRGASGFWVENGEITYPVNECTVAGNLREMLRSIVPANDARKHLSRVVPSLLVEGLTIAGA